MMMTNQAENVSTPATPTATPRRSAADVLFPDVSGDTPVPPTAAAPALDSWTPNADEVALFGHDHRPPHEVFSIETAVRPALQERRDEVATILLLGEAERTQRHRAFVAAIRESGLDPNTTGQQLYHLMTDAEIAAVHGRDLDDSQAAPMFESINRDLLARFGPERGEQLVRALTTYVGAHPGLQRVLATPGIKTRFGFRKAFEEIIEHVRVQGNL